MRRSATLARTLQWAAAALAAVCAAGAAQAHALDPRMGDFYAGMAHPLTALEHLLPIVALGLLVGQHGLKKAQVVLLLFPAAFAAGAAASIALHALPWVFAVNVAWAVLLGALVAAAPRGLPLAATCAIAIGTGLTHGYANGQAMSAQTRPLLFISGMALAAFVALAYASLAADLVLRQKPQWPRIAVRALGSWIAAIGILVLALAHRMAMAS